MARFGGIYYFGQRWLFLELVLTFAAGINTDIYGGKWMRGCHGRMGEDGGGFGSVGWGWGLGMSRRFAGRGKPPSPLAP